MINQIGFFVQAVKRNKDKYENVGKNIKVN